MVVAQIPVDWDAIRNFLDSNAIIIGILFKVLIIIVAWIFFSLLIRKISGKLTPTQYNALKTLGRATILLFGLFWMGGNEFFIGAAALLGTAIGFASSSTIGNFINGQPMDVVEGANQEQIGKLFQKTVNRMNTA